MDALEEDDLYEEISKLKICLEEKNMIIDTLTYQLAKREKHNEKLECEIVGLRKDIEKTKALNLRFAKGSETSNEIIRVQHSPLIRQVLDILKKHLKHRSRQPPLKAILMQQRAVNSLTISKGIKQITK